LLRKRKRETEREGEREKGRREREELLLFIKNLDTYCSIYSPNFYWDRYHCRRYCMAYASFSTVYPGNGQKNICK